MKKTKQQIIEGLTADLLTEKSHSLKLESRAIDLEKEVQKFQRQYYDADFKVRELEEQIRSIRVINAVEVMAMIKSSITLLKYCSDPNATHRRKEFYVSQAEVVLKKQYDECFRLIFPNVDTKDYPF